MVLRYTLIVLVYLICFISPLIPGFPKGGSASGDAYAAVFFLTLIIVSLLLIPERTMFRGPLASLGESIAWAICGVFILFVLQIAAALINNLILGQPLQSKHTQDVVQLTRNAPVFIFAVSIIGPMLEEIVFRKIFFGSMKKKLGFFFAALISSLIFAAFHFDFSHLLIYLAIGFFLCYAYHKTGRIWVTMFMHAAMNAIVVLISLSVRLPNTVSWIHWPM
ncbi:CPBP family intramembrane metalloprotease [Sporolactobacillus shoreicorticis]|uniref:CPBP family intramembrane glutamic endopeptidase n=1 Tax=Sporolactobacillus shoreicorticis TaxID=1923877 RepID=A0ABW5RZE3_9BACL|nr:type II CAAX endopeptidase family protein [Sporolactobacillus shoreicorticis]MCO7128014.1 CPBP family intramembrane metalloprotease [Sporolactobacillus shoreicorticis]